jgi:hypothetical protein
MKMEPIEGSETSAISTQTPGKHPKENILHIKHGEDLKSRMNMYIFCCSHKYGKAQNSLSSILLQFLAIAHTLHPIGLKYHAILDVISSLNIPYMLAFRVQSMQSSRYYSTTRCSQTLTIIFILPALVKKPINGHKIDMQCTCLCVPSFKKFQNSGQTFTKLGTKFVIYNVLQGQIILSFIEI